MLGRKIKLAEKARQVKCILKSLSCTTIIISGRRVLTRALKVIPEHTE